MVSSIDSEEMVESVEQARPVFDANLWQYDEAKDQFVHTKTGEVRAESDFAWPDPFADDLAGGDEWDAPQAAMDDDNQSGGGWNDSQIRQGRKKK